MYSFTVWFGIKALEAYNAGVTIYDFQMKKRIGRFVLHWLLAPVARMVYRKYKPRIIAVTGSVGKTTTREAIYQTLKPYFDIEKAKGNGNADWSVVATILNPGYQPFTYNSKGWGIMLPQHVLVCWWMGILRVILPFKYPKMFVLELGIDAPCDMDFFNSLFQYDVAIVTRVGQAHLEFFEDYKHLFSEKTKIFSGLKSSGLAVGNADQPDLAKKVNDLVVRHALVGEDVLADVKIIGDSVSDDDELFSHRMVSYQVDATKLQFSLPFGRQWIPAVGVALAVAREFGLSFEQFDQAVRSIENVDRRFEVHKLRNGIVLVDDAYNANLDSMKLAVDGLMDIPSRRKIAVVGDMKELGDSSLPSHEELGVLLASKVDLLFTVGKLGEVVGRAAKGAGMRDDRVVSSGDLQDSDVTAFGDVILERIQDNDAVLVKASRSMGLSRVAKYIINKLS